MKKIKALLILAFVALSACNSSDDAEAIVQQPAAEITFQIDQNRATLTELEEIQFTLTPSESNLAIMNVSWFINGEQQESNYVDMRKLFARAGNYAIRAEVNYQKSNTQFSKIIEKTVTVAARASYNVKLKKVEILSIVNVDRFYVPMLGYYMWVKYEIEGIDDQGLAYIAYMSTVNSTNTGGSMQFPITWDMSAANRNIKVYESGNYYPDNLWYNSRIVFHAATRGNGTQNPYFILDTLFVDLNQYRFLKPSQVDFSNNGIAYRLTLDWN